MPVEEAPPRTQGTPCPTCGAPAERGQLVCLECGSRIALAYRRPPSWKIPVAIVATIAVLAVAGGVLAYDAIDDEASDEVAATPLNPKKGASTNSSTDSEENEQTNTEKETTAAKERTAAERRKEAAAKKKAAEQKAARKRLAGGGTTPEGLVKKGKLYTWPRGLDNFTVVVLSTEDRASATAFANQVADAKAAKAGVIRSDDFETLPTGFYIVFAGSYPTQARADRAAARLGRRYQGAFPQLVRR